MSGAIVDIVQRFDLKRAEGRDDLQRFLDGPLTHVQKILADTIDEGIALPLLIEISIRPIRPHGAAYYASSNVLTPELIRARGGPDYEARLKDYGSILTQLWLAYTLKARAPSTQMPGQAQQLVNTFKSGVYAAITCKFTDKENLEALPKQPEP